MVKKGASKKTAAAPPRPDSSSKPASAHQATGSAAVAPLQSSKDQQRLLDIFSDAFGSVLSSDTFSSVLQEIKQALFNRDFSAAFGREDYLEAYAARWSPTRALCYSNVFLGIREHLGEILVSGSDGIRASAPSQAAEDDSVEKEELKDPPTEAEPSQVPPISNASSSGTSGRLRMVSIGGCAAEHLAFASYLHATDCQGNLTLLDSAPWSSVTTLLQNKTITEPPISKYASAAAKAANRPLLLPDQLSYSFTQQDVLDLDQEALSNMLGPKPLVVTMLFTLNELYTSGGIGKTTKLLKNLGQVLPHGSMMLVVDSPGSYSEAAVGKEKKKYPMQWLLDHTLTGVETPGYKWDRLESNESVWFRLSDGLSYPIPLENMRYQIHLYRIDRKS